MLKPKCAEGHAVAGRKPKLTPEQIEQARFLKANRYSYLEIGQRMGVSHTTIRKALLGLLVDRSRPEL